MKILFICKHNRFRSRVAETIFNKLEGGAKSAGVRIDVLRPYVASKVLNIMKDRGYDVEDREAILVNHHLINWADKIIIVANNVSPDLFPRGKTEVWQIEDCDEEEFNKISLIIESIEKKVKNLIKRIKK